jgi:nucleoside diphosphate kinase
MKIIKVLGFVFAAIFIFDIKAAQRVERTFAMIKPHAVKEGRADEILEMIRRSGFTIIALKKIVLTDSMMHELYKEYTLRLWFRKYIKSMTKGPAVVMVLEKKDAVAEWEKYKTMIRKYYGLLYTHKNAVHGSDTLREARQEIGIFFPELQKK